MENLTNWLAQYNVKLEDVILFLTPIVAALAILLFGWMAARFAARWVRKREFGKLEPSTAATLRPVLASVVGYFIFLSAIYAALIKLNVPATSLLAAFGGAALAIGLALQGTLSNIASGIMLLFLRPLKVGDFVDTNGVIGTVEEIGLFSTSIKNVENVYYYLPNSKVWADRIQNFNRHDRRKVVIDIGVSYSADLEKTKALLVQTMKDIPFSLDDIAEPEVYVMSFGDSSVNLSCRCWLPPDNWLESASTVRIALKKALDDNGIEIPFPQRVVTMKGK